MTLYNMVVKSLFKGDYEFGTLKNNIVALTARTSQGFSNLPPEVDCPKAKAQLLQLQQRHYCLSHDMAGGFRCPGGTLVGESRSWKQQGTSYKY